MSSKKKNKSKPKTNGATKKKGPRQKPLPGMEDRQIERLQDAAMEYAEMRDARIAATASEVQSKKALLDLMHSYKKTRYVHGNVYVEIVPEGEKLKVKILEEGEEAPELKSSRQTSFEPSEMDDKESPEKSDAEDESESAAASA